MRKKHYTDRLVVNKGNIKETWKIINSLINKQSKSKTYSTEFISIGNIVRGDKTIANGFNTFFVDIGPALADNIPKTDDVFTQYLSVNGTDTMFIEPITEEEILCLVHKAKNKKSKGHDELDMWLVKKIIPHIVTPLKHIFNTSLQKGIFPDAMKIAWVIPLFKNGDNKEFTNYRHVSLLPQFSKNLERIFHKRLMNFHWLY